jgi:hypothetical protein
VYSLTDYTSPIATYEIFDNCCSGLIANNCLYLAGQSFNIIVFELSASLTEPLKQLPSIPTSESIIKLKKVGQDLLLGETSGIIEVFDPGNF